MPRSVYSIIVLYNLSLWWSFWSWYQLLRNYTRYADWVARHEHVDKRRQLLQLLRLMFGRGVPAAFYYRYRLYAYSPIRWWDFIYDHELPHWHLTFSSGNKHTKSSHLITDKAAFTDHMSIHGIQTVKTIAILQRGSKPNAGLIFDNQSLFFKPRHGSCSRGIFALLFNNKTNHYQLRSGDMKLDKREEILEYILQQTATNDYLIQPLLDNHTTIAMALKDVPLLTLRIITALYRSDCITVSANIEIPAKHPGNRVNNRYGDRLKRSYAYPVDLTTGIVGKRPIPDLLHVHSPFDNLVGLTLPYWPQALTLCHNAHAQCADITTIGWDVAITGQGAALLEGNTNWGTATHQRVHAHPLLQGPLAHIYQQKNVKSC